MARRPRLFFSHSTQKNSPDRAILNGISAGLATDFDILLDRTTLETGSDWRSTINVWIATCDCAIILVTPESIKSDYCRYEWAVLSFRRRQENFRIIPIYYGSTPNEISGRADQINEIAGYYEFDSIPSVTEKVRAQLAAELVIRDGANLQILLIAIRLKQALEKEEVIETVANKINLELGSWDLSSDKWQKFATMIMGLGILDALPALRKLQSFFGRRKADEFNEIVDLVGKCSWVDIASAQRIRGCEHRQARTPTLFGLNANEFKTAECYVLSGSGQAPSSNWRIGAALGVYGSYEDLRQQITSELFGVLRLEGRDIAKLKRRIVLEGPVFVVLRIDGLDAEWLNQLCAEELFAQVNFFVLTGELDIKAGCLADDSWLKPLLAPGVEDRVWEDYAEAKEILNTEAKNKRRIA
jgi:hypothetical protein